MPNIAEDAKQHDIPNFLIDNLRKQYGDEITKEIQKGYFVNRAVTMRVNTLKSDASTIKSILEKTGIAYERVSWNEDAFILKNVQKGEIEKWEMYEKGEIYLQSLSSMLPPLILNPKQGEDILDMAAAPGGKTTQMAAICKNKANITACEMNVIRAQRLKYNIEKQGATCIYVMQADARKIDSFFSFDKILLDAPCSGSGTLSVRDKDLEKYFTPKLIEKSMKSQLALLKKAISVLKPGKEMVYSTCSILSCENEKILQKALASAKAEIVPIQLEKMDRLPLLPVTIKGTICVCPDERYEGFFIAKIRKNR